MATKRQVVAQLTPADLRLVAEAAKAGSSTMETKDARKVRRAVKILRTAGDSKANGGE